MRTTFNMKYAQSLDSILGTQDKLQKASLMLNNQTKILTAADDPSGASRAIGLEANIQQPISIKPIIQRRVTAWSYRRLCMTVSVTLWTEPGF